MFRWTLAIMAALPLTAEAPKALPRAIADVLTCRAVSDMPARLACFEASAERLDAQSQSGELIVIDKAVAEAAKRDTFGLGLPRLSFLEGAGDGKPLQGLDGVLARARTLPGEGFWRFELEDGSVWRQLSGAPLPSARPGSKVRITRGAVGSFWIKIGDQPPVKAHRDQ